LCDFHRKPSFDVIVGWIGASLNASHYLTHQNKSLKIQNNLKWWSLYVLPVHVWLPPTIQKHAREVKWWLYMSPRIEREFAWLVALVWLATSPPHNPELVWAGVENGWMDVWHIFQLQLVWLKRELLIFPLEMSFSSS